MNKPTDQQRGEQAKRILEDPLFVEAVQKIRQDLQIEWLNSELQNTEQRENIFVMRRMLEVVLVQLQSVMETGKLSQKK
jgi:hypothetical protein|tara:strand:- start:6819 stop:7055 length:237 start_codon:yes stop_codon:yes gene_type:complete